MVFYFFPRRYEFFKILLNDFSNYHGFITIVSLLAGVVATTMVNPFWVINARMTVSKVLFLMKRLLFFHRQKMGFLRLFFRG